jgi:outer membrane protein TolC
VFCFTTLLAASAVAQSGLAAPPASSVMQSASENPLLGSVSPAKPEPGTIDVSLLEALNRGLRTNLGLLLSQQGTAAAEAQRLRVLNYLLPNVNAHIADSSQQINIQAFGFPVAKGSQYVFGPFNVFDARVQLQSNIFNLQANRSLRAAETNLKSSRFALQNTRELVVLAVGLNYLDALRQEARVQAAQAQVNTAEALYKQASDMKSAGVVAGLDVLRAQVEMQAQQQRLVVAQSDFEKQKLAFGRVIGLAPAQQFNLTDKIPAPFPLPATLDQYIERAYQNRADYKQAATAVLAAEQTKSAAAAQKLPSVAFQGDYGTIGKSPTQNHGTYSATAAINIPVFTGTRVKADVAEAEANVQARRAEYEDLRGRVEFDVRSAWLDYDAANRQLQVAESNLTLAREQLTQSRDRFAAGVTNNLEVVQSQEAQATAEDNYISALFGHNFAKLALARAVGIAEDATKKFLGGK